MATLIIIIIIVICIAYYLFTEHTLGTWIVIGSIAAAIGIGIAIYRAYKKQQQIAQEREQNLLIVNSPEPATEDYFIPTTTTFSGEEEKAVNLLFTEYLKYLNATNKSKTRLNYLTKKVKALYALDRCAEAHRLEDEIAHLKRLAASSANPQPIYRSSYNDLFFSNSEVMHSFSNLTEPLNNVNYPILRAFFTDKKIVITEGSANTVVIFTPGYILFFNNEKNFLKLVSYDSIRVSTSITTEALRETMNSDDEVARIGYRYETQSGNKDKRYSYNPAQYYVYRGSVTIAQGWENSCVVLFSNKSKTRSYEQNVKDYINQMKGRYKRAVTAMLHHDNSFAEATSLNDFLALPVSPAASKLYEKAVAAQHSTLLSKSAGSTTATAGKATTKSGESVIQSGTEESPIGKKQHLLAQLIIPSFKRTAIPKCPKVTLAEEQLLQKALHNLISHHNRVQKAQAFALYAKAHSAQITQIKHINRELGLDEWDGIECFHIEDSQSTKPTALLPQRFKKLNEAFRQDSAWDILYAEPSKQICSSPNKEDLRNTFFIDQKSLFFENAKKESLFLCPYCIIFYPTSDRFNVLTYLDAEATVSYQDKLECRNIVPPDGELISERKMYLNADGSPDRRHRNNPTVKVIRYSTLCLQFKREAQIISFVLNIPSYTDATQFAHAFNTFVASFQSGDKRALYNLVLTSAPDDEFDRLIREQEERKEQKRLEAEAEARAEQARLEQERLDAQKAAEERKAAALRRQQELVEERRRQREESARIQRLFGSDENIQEESKPTIVANDEGSSAAFAVVGKHSISNNTFKIILKQQKPVEDNNLYAYFVDSTGRTISNKKRVPVVNVGEEFPLGFVLTAGIDYTKMTACTFRIASATSTCADIGFEMHIAFFSDF